MIHDRIFMVWGPPGTGKTKSLAAWLNEQAHKYGGSNVMACSYTKAAATEIAGRDLRIHRENIGTLHAFCYRMIGDIQLTSKHEDEFGKDFPRFKLASQKRDLDQPQSEHQTTTMGDELLEQMELYRNRRIDHAFWKPSVKAFAKAWSTWKDRNGLKDFTDLLELALNDCDDPPHGAKVGVLDEAQDSTKLQIELILKWASKMDKFILAGDEDQSLYGWCGADPETLLDLPIPAKHKKVLSQSYRVPRVIHAAAEKWIKKVSRREPKEYRARDAEGQISRHQARYRDPDHLLKTIDPYLQAGKRVMFLTSCSYMLEPIKRMLREAAIPFSNPYRRKRADWNPLHTAKKKVMPVERVLAFMKGDIWSWHDVYLWADWLKAKGIFRPGGKEWLEKSCKGAERPFDAQEFLTWLEPEAHEAFYEISCSTPNAAQKSLQWWLKNCLIKKRQKLSYPVKVAMKHGWDGLVNEPQVVVGTIHSVKGGESDCVVLCPDVSTSGFREWQSAGPSRDAVRRMFYVGMTRAKEALIICQASSGAAVTL